MLLQCYRNCSILQHFLSQNRPTLIGSRFKIHGFQKSGPTRLSLDFCNNFENLSLELRIVAKLAQAALDRDIFARK